MRILLTGGHFSPAYSVLKKLKRDGHVIAIAGRKHTFEGDASESFEYMVARKEKINFYPINTGRVQRKFTINTIPSLFKVTRGFYDSLNAIKKFKPDVILTFGGYVGFPVVYAASFKRIPVVLHEQTQKAGLASKVISRVAKKVCISFESSKNYFPASKVVFTGNPVREEIFEINEVFKVKRGYPTIYFTGGSSGSHFINTIVFECLEKLLKKYNVIHQAGSNKYFEDYEKLAAKKESLSDDLKQRYFLKKFVYPSEIGSVFKASDLIISRSGINTVVELLSLGKMCLLIPLPFGQTGEQLDNAKFVSTVGIGDYAEEKDVNPDFLIDKINYMIKNRNKFESNSKNAGIYIKNDATDRIVRVIEELYAIKNR